MLTTSVRYTFIQIRMLEQMKKFGEIPRVILKLTNVENSVPFLHPLPFEKASLYYLLDDQSILNKKFCFY